MTFIFFQSIWKKNSYEHIQILQALKVEFVTQARKKKNAKKVLVF